MQGGLTLHWLTCGNEKKTLQEAKGGQRSEGTRRRRKRRCRKDIVSNISMVPPCVPNGCGDNTGGSGVGGADGDADHDRNILWISFMEMLETNVHHDSFEHPRKAIYAICTYVH